VFCHCCSGVTGAVEFDTVLVLLIFQARIAELEEELEAERASRTKVGSLPVHNRDS